MMVIPQKRQVQNCTMSKYDSGEIIEKTGKTGIELHDVKIWEW